MNLCPLCVEEQADPKSPYYKDADRRGKPPIPCSRHGDPRLLWSENAEAIAIYNKLEGHHIQKQYKSGEREFTKYYIDMAVAVQLCRAYMVDDIPEMLDKLVTIHDERCK